MNKKQVTILGLVGAAALAYAFFGGYQPFAQTSPPQETVQNASSSQHFVIKRSVGIQGSTTKSINHPSNSPSTSTVPYSIVYVQLSDPDGVSNFEVNLNPGDDLCANLVEAKAEGKIRSLLIDDSYLATFGSRYVREINGYSNNWTVKVNETRPEGCSLYKPKAGDYIEWKFGQ
ncbi:hypothetical protein A3C18_03765 [Candidatus Kaiserbacteria bacterium RIFCSPHIGHO2_02_FULL_54_11b]|uniref:Transcobalamin-like C-terminal domain-containing protein n=1 Tax=Candidatus Kaiserbacteria bacterium RIFCSPHIGHO2_02_FULL_54_11b TaxID=1798494 RepID=A0A1F6DRP2_9BACT|nr:MAG: hypothetical protein A3C18_03765 [Candidatus Kaiserbacteria bacterium RIFCSPHIGHO2_02_FULL_54_11b]